ILLGETNRSVEDVLQQHVDQFDSQGANFSAAASVLVAEPHPMLLDLEEVLVERQRFHRPHLPRGSEFALGMRQDFSEMSRGGHLHFGFWISDFGLELAETSPLNPKSTI